jgi:PilZ domain-containing protein
MARIDLTDLHNEKQISGHTKDLNLFGCFVETTTPFSKGTKVRFQISLGDTQFVALGKVTYSRSNSGMGISFAKIEPSSLPVLDGWLASLRC